MYCRRPGIGVAEYPCHVDLHVLDVADGQGEVAGAHADEHDVSGRTDRLDATDHGGRRTTGVDEGVDLGVEPGDVVDHRIEHLGGTEAQHALAARLQRIGDDDACGSEGTGG